MMDQPDLTPHTLRKFTQHLIKAADKQRRHKEVLEDVKGHVQRIHSMRRKGDREAELQQLQDKIAKHLKEERRLRKQTQQDHERIDELEARIEELTSEVEENKEELHETERKVDRISHKELEDMERALKDLESRHKQLLKKHGKTHLEPLSKKISEHKKKISQLKKKAK